VPGPKYRMALGSRWRLLLRVSLAGEASSGTGKWAASLCEPEATTGLSLMDRSCNLMRLCVDCRKPFEPIHEDAIVCAPCCHLEQSEICFQALSLGEGSVECAWARKDHPEPHLWEGVIGDAKVKIEWRKIT
jgi:hypothetical protein